MGITQDRGRFYFVMRVPKRYRNVDTRSQVRQALHTDSRAEAIRKAPAIEEQFVAYWEDLIAGNDVGRQRLWVQIATFAKRVLLAHRNHQGVGHETDNENRAQVVGEDRQRH
jgi:hypothetical protein